MNSEQAENAVIVSSLIVAGIYMFRKLTEPAIPPTSKHSAATLPSVGRFVTGWGFAFLVISAIAEASPGLGGAFAILAATGDILVNGAALTTDINSKLGTPPTPAPTSSATIGAVGTPYTPDPNVNPANPVYSPARIAHSL